MGVTRGGDDDADLDVLERIAGVVASATSGNVDDTLNSIVDGVDSFISSSIGAAIVLVDGHVSSGLRLAACRGLSRDFEDALERDPEVFRASVPARAIHEHRPILVPDLLGDPAYERWWRWAKDEGYRSILATPMSVGGAAIGSLNIYRNVTGDLPKREILLVETFARVAAGVLQTSILLNDRDHQMDALERLVRALQDQAHEHANRLQAIRGLIAIGEADQAVRFVAEVSETTASIRSEIGSTIEHPTVAGLLIALSGVVAQQGIRFEIDPDSRLSRQLPINLTDSQLVTILGNLIDNASAAVADEVPRRRKIRLTVREDAENVTFEVRDWGSGLSMSLDEAVAWGVTSKSDHVGAGLSLVNRIVSSAMGVLEASRHSGGTTFTVRVPIVVDRTP